MPFNKSWEIIYNNEGENDGLVSVKSQKWKDKITGGNGKIKIIPQKEFPILADHFNQVGWWNLFQLKNLKWWQLNVIKEKEKYEKKIKLIYLKMINELNSI